MIRKVITMKRVKSACICQTLHFMLKEDIDHALAARQVAEEVEHYKATLEKSGTKYKLVSEEKLADESVVIKIIKQYSQSPVGDYLD